MILTPLIDIDNLDPTNSIIYIFLTFVVIDDKGGEIVYKDRVKRQQRGREIKI